MDYIFKKLQIQALTKEAHDTLVGACLFKLGSGLILAWGSINLYFYSYFFEIEEGFQMKKASVTFGVMMLFLGFGSVLSVQLAEKFGFERIIRGCGILYILSIYLCVFMQTFNNFAIFYLLIGCTAFTISAIPILNCVWSHFDQNQSGKVSGLSFFCLSLSTIVTIFLFTAIINPDNNSPTITKKEGDQEIKIFDEHISSRFQLTMIIINTIQAIFLIPGSLKITKKKISCSQDESSSRIQEMQIVQQNSQNSPNQQYNYKIEEDDENAQNQLSLDKNQVNDKQKLNKNKEKSDESTRTSVIVDSQYYPPLKQSLFTEPFMMIYLTGILNALYIAFLSMNFKVYASTKINDDYFLTFILIVNQILGGVANLTFGHIIDRFCYKKCLLIIQVVIGLFAATIPLISTSKPLLLIWYVIIGMVSNGLQTIMGPIFIKIFGVDTGSKLLPIKATSFFIAVIIVQMVNYLVFTYMTYDSAITTLGIIIFLGFALLARLKTSYTWSPTQ
ncbi:hypothetical protein ABPG72_007078 [Tetrahymena utriculariae]